MCCEKTCQMDGFRGVCRVVQAFAGRLGEDAVGNVGDLSGGQRVSILRRRSSCVVEDVMLQFEAKSGGGCRGKSKCG